MSQAEASKPYQQIQVPDGLIPGVVDLEGLDGNAMVLIGTVRRALRLAGNDRDVLDAFSNEAIDGDYQHVIQTCLAYTKPS